MPHTEATGTYSATPLNISWIAVKLPIKVTAILELYSATPLNISWIVVKLPIKVTAILEPCRDAAHGSYGDVLGHALEHLLDRREVADQGHCHLGAFWREAAHGSYGDVLGNALEHLLDR